VNFFLRRKLSEHSFLIGFLILLIILSIGLENKSLSFLLGEGGLIEISQILILLATLIFQIKYYKLFSTYCYKSLLALKTFILIVISYEELSFFSFNSNSLITKNNMQAEVNIHNLDIMFSPIFSGKIFGFEFGLNYYFVIFSLVLFIFGYGSYFISNHKIKNFFLEKKYAIYTFVFPLNELISTLLRDFNLISRHYFLHMELLELFLYLILILDLFNKKIKFASQLKKKLKEKNF